jgi:Family of unknown function (DUF6328)
MAQGTGHGRSSAPAHRGRPGGAAPSPDSQARDAARRETPAERSDRNWNELLQELRVTQTGVQILTGFLLTIPFQERFEDLDDYQRTVYLVLVLLAVLTTGLIVAPVSLHRIMFGKHLKRELVVSADRLARAGLLTLSLTISGAALLVFDVVVGRTAGLVVGVAVLVLLAVCWLAYPVRVTRSASNGTGRGA